MSDWENGLDRGHCRSTACAICSVIPKFIALGNLGLIARCLRGRLAPAAAPLPEMGACALVFCILFKLNSNRSQPLTPAPSTSMHRPEFHRVAALLQHGGNTQR